MADLEDRQRRIDTLRRWRAPILVGVDVIAWSCGGVTGAVATNLLWDAPPEAAASGVLVVAGICAFLGVGRLTTMHVVVRRIASFEEILLLVLTMGLSTAVIAVPAFVVGESRGVLALVTGAAALFVAATTRIVWRVLIERRLRPDGARAVRVVVYGAGDSGREAITRMLTDPSSPCLPVALVDDDPRKARSCIHGVRVCGRGADLVDVAHRHHARGLLIAIPSETVRLVRSVAPTAQDAGLQVYVRPPLSVVPRHLTYLDPGWEAVGSGIGADLPRIMGRVETSHDMTVMERCVVGARVLVTGAGGSIGSELCRQLARLGSEIIMLDHDESALHGVQLSIDGRGRLDSASLVVADIRDRERVDDVFARWEPQLVFHAAALKHVPLLELNPTEGLKTNVTGTLNVLQAAARHGASPVVNISTDKAADPRCVLGYTKYLGERITATLASSTATTFVSVRFGNVLGSRGSVLTTFGAQIRAGGPVTVTHPEVTRYLMTIPEAVRLVIEAASIGAPGETMVLDMGAPVRIRHVAERLIESSGKDVEIVYTGLRPGEKLHEVLVAEGETTVRRGHPMLSHLCVPPIRLELLEALHGVPDEAVPEALASLCASPAAAIVPVEIVPA